MKNPLPFDALEARPDDVTYTLKVLDAGEGDGLRRVLFQRIVFADLGNDGAAQARFAWRAIEAAGGELPGTLPLMLDVERGGQSITNPTAQRVRDVVSSFAETYLALSGRRPTLYTGELARALGLRDMMGCERGVVALYGKELHGANESTVQFLERTAGMTLETLLAWQYCGDGVRELAGYPNEAPGVGRCDISVLTLPGGLEAVRAIAQPGPTTLR